ncbi:universal stress protein [Neolewinella agarilytica]|uniref:universal stress protein n=1 Tax=Neolewinella agarilytica TaxID=478744 RepID=UPI0023571B97|nr:universal stress protein [Neolewinella agarilytica]
MKNILVPVDFSNTSAAALSFGTYLAKVMDLDLKAVHVFDANFSFAQVVSTGALLAEKEGLTEKLNDFTQAHALPVLATFQGNLETLPTILTEVFEGSPPKMIRRLSERVETELVVMGGMGAGKSDNPPWLFGGVARKIGLRGGCPVILLPPGYSSPSVNRVAIAFGDAEDIKKTSLTTRRIIKALRPEVRFVHVSQNTQSFERENEEYFLSLALEPGFPSNTFSYDSLPPGPVAHSLLNYARDEKIGLLVLNHRKHSLWEDLFLKNHVKPLLRHSEVPLLIVPVTDQN